MKIVFSTLRKQGHVNVFYIDDSLQIGSSKGGLVMLTKNLALELAEYNIQVNY